MLHVILLHGLGAHGITLTMFENHIKDLNIKIHVCSYLTFFNTIENITKKIIKYVQHNINPSDDILIIGHSLGGIIARHICSSLSTHHIRTVMTLGTPHDGAILANRIFAFLPPIKLIKIVRQLSKQSKHINSCPHFPDHIRHVNIIGIKKLDWINPLNWITLLMLSNEHSHDGVVEYDSCISTRNDAVHEIYISHIGMLFSEHVERIISYEIYRIIKDEMRNEDQTNWRFSCNKT